MISVLINQKKNEDEQAEEFNADNFDGAILIYDNKHFKLETSNKLKVCLSQKKMRIAEYKKIDYLERIKDLY